MGSICEGALSVGHVIFLLPTPVQAHPEAEQFRNKGWPFYEKMAALIPHNPKGQRVYRAGRPRKAAQPVTQVDSELESEEPPVQETQDSQEPFMDPVESQVSVALLCGEHSV